MPAVAAGTIDLTANKFAITAARLKLINFSIPFHSQVEALVVLSTNTTPYVSLEDLRGQVVGTVRGSLYDPAINAMKGVFRDVKLYTTTWDVPKLS